MTVYIEVRYADESGREHKMTIEVVDNTTLPEVLAAVMKLHPHEVVVK